MKSGKPESERKGEWGRCNGARLLHYDLMAIIETSSEDPGK